MNHQKGNALIAGIILAIASVYADYEQLNIFGGLGIGFSSGGALYRSENAIDSKVNDRFFNYGGGLKFDIGSQYTLRDELALQGSFSYSAGIPAIEEEIVESSSSKTTTTYKRHLFGIKLHLIPKFQVLDLLDMYAGIGTGFYWNSRPFEIVRQTSSGEQKAQGNITSSPALGFSGLIGVDYPIDDKITAFGEFGFEQINFNLSKVKINKSTIPAYQGGNVINYEKNSSGNNNLPPEKVPGSNIQIRFGVRYALM